jgi:ABC-type Zn2+ transport system substrate-binding protein/surface adhesin
MSGEIAQQPEVIKDLWFIVFHDAFHNFEQRFRIEAVGAISDNGAVPPSPKRIVLVRAVAGDVQIVEADEEVLDSISVRSCMKACYALSVRP